MKSRFENFWQWWTAWNDKAISDIVLIVISCVCVFFLSAELDIFEEFYTFSEAHEAWELDEIFMVLINLTIACGLFYFKMYRRMRAEMRERLQAEQSLQELAMNDALTGLANRRHFNERLQEAVSETSRSNLSFAVLMIDLDRFKPVNDLYGHAVGDRLLQAIAERVGELIRAHDCFARLGGDEFALLARIHDQKQDDPARLATRILKALEAPFEIDDITCRIGASIGIAVSHGDETGDKLLNNADLALYSAKDAGRGAYRFFEVDMNQKIVERAKLELHLRQAIQLDEIRPYFQPFINFSTGRHEGYEILARWTHEIEGEIEPSVFIPIAEDTGLIGDLTLHMLRQACLEAADWPDKGIYLSLNVSPVQLRDPELSDKFMRVLNEVGFTPSRLEVEVTENSLIQDIDAARDVLRKLKDCGMRIALDDFGTGYSSLHHLQELPFDKLKIDKSFVLSMSDTEDSRKIVDAMISLGRSLGLETTAEGVETEEVARQLRELGCTVGQGFLFGRPTAELDTPDIDLLMRDKLAELQQAIRTYAPHIEAEEAKASKRKVLSRNS